MLDISEKEKKNMSESSSVLIQEIRKNGIPAFWMDTRKMQDAYSLEIKGSLISDIFSVCLFPQKFAKITNFDFST